ncbi:MAG: DUF2613 domain-containing protein [SAR324 cluster bacterium]|nr:DUF2613 domain-containing protein [SAR324 cluster bacterium]
MAEEEMDDLDGLDDFGSNDFEDNLDDFMEGDLDAGDDGGDGGDSELDSFFEDLSTIDDLEVKEEDPVEEEEEPEAEAELEIEEEEEAAPPPPPKDKKPILIPAIISAVIGIVLGLIAVGVMWWINQPEEELPPPTTMPTTTLMPRPVQPVVTVPTLPPTTLAPVKALPPPPKKQYYVQVANCIYQECIDDFRFLLKRFGYKTTIVLQDEKAPMTEVLSRQVIGEEEAAKWVDRINQENQLPGEAYRKAVGTRYQVSLGLFPDLETAARVKVYLNQLYAKQLVFEAKQAAQTIRYSKIRAGQFQSREEAIQLQKILLKKDKRFRGAFVVSVLE